jgi:hypothetical protein
MWIITRRWKLYVAPVVLLGVLAVIKFVLLR